ncbi:hypothetical protein [Mesorhizobium sp. M0800]
MKRSSFWLSPEDENAIAAILQRGQPFRVALPGLIGGLLGTWALLI